MLRLVLAAVLVVGAWGALAQDSADERRLRALVARLPVTEQPFFEKAAYAGRYTLSGLVTYTLREGRLAARFHLPDELVRQFKDPAPLMIAVEGSPHVWTVHRRKAGTLDEGLSLVTLSCFAPDDAWPFNRFSISSDGGTGVMVAGAQMFGPPRWRQSVTLNQTGRSLVARWQLEADKYVARGAEVADLAGLSRQSPSVVESYLLPVLRRLGAARSVADVYRVFDQIPADPAVTKQVLPLVVRLEARDPAAREAAWAGLKAMGRPAILACLRLEPEVLSPEQASRLSAFYASEGWVRVDVEAARREVGFLTACLEDEDPRVRVAAENSLGAIRAARGIGK